jgi:hypothetical protein
MTQLFLAMPSLFATLFPFMPFAGHNFPKPFGEKIHTKKTLSQFKFQFNFENKLILQLKFQ